MNVYVLKSNCNHANGIGKVIGLTTSIIEANQHNEKSSSNEYELFQLQNTVEAEGSS